MTATARTHLVVGASGATGKLLVTQLLERGQRVRAVVRSPDSLPDAIRNHAGVALIHAPVLGLSDEDLARHVRGCAAVHSCLGHNLTMKGIFGPPRRLVTDATRRLCKVIQANAATEPTRFVLMNTAGNSNRDLHEPVSFGQACVLVLLRLLLPPHADNENAADWLRTGIGPADKGIEWVAVRPDNLVDAGDVTEYALHPSPTRSALFNPGVTSRINVAHFMAELATDESLWKKWKAQMPVIYNKPASRPA